MNQSGLLLCARYSSAPNFFGYCGPEENASLIDHLREDVTDREVKTILSQFDTLFSYLKLIAFENNIKEPFDPKVVEAYWIGNQLLNNISNKNYSYFLEEELNLGKKLEKPKLQKIKTKVLSTKFFPHHAFHVFNIFKRTGHVNSNHTLETMDSCRIGWGKIEKNQISNLKFQINSKDQIIKIKTKPLLIVNNRLTLGLPVYRKLKMDYKGKSFLKNLNPGDWVSFHWGFVCDALTPLQVKNLEFYTQQAIEFYNS